MHSLYAFARCVQSYSYLIHLPPSTTHTPIQHPCCAATLLLLVTMISRRAATATAAAGIVARRWRLNTNVWRSSSTSSNNNNSNSSSPTTSLTPSPSSSHHNQPLSLGYQAGIQSTILGISFDDSYQILSNSNSTTAQDDDAIFDSQLLLEYENDMQTKQGVMFVWSTKEVSVIDVTDNIDTEIMNRCLIFNDRPHLIQSSIRIDSGDNGVDNAAVAAPPHLLGESGTHLGGLALAVPLLDCITSAHDNQKQKKTRKEKEAIVIGAGACTVPMVLSNNSSWNVRAIEPSHDVLHAAKTYFGAEAKNLELIASTGEEYLASILQQQQQQTATSLEEKDNDESKSGKGRKCQILIVDAEDGSSISDDDNSSEEEEIILTAPPKSMQSKEFWSNLVVPNLDNDKEAVIAINVIGTKAATKRFQNMLKDALPNHYDIVSCGVPHEAGVSSRHSLLFALSRPLEEEHLDDLLGNKLEMLGMYVDLPHLWLRELKKGMLRPI